MNSKEANQNNKLSQTFKLLRKTAGVLLIILGVVSFFLPVLQGWLFILLGAILLESVWVKKHTHRLKAKWATFVKKTFNSCE